jgi:hypothetical protein
VKNRATKCRREREREVLLCVDGWEDVTMVDKRPKAYTFTNNAGPQFSLLPDAKPMVYFIVFLVMSFWLTLL